MKPTVRVVVDSFIGRLGNALPSQEQLTFGHPADDRHLLHFLNRLSIKTVLG